MGRRCSGGVGVRGEMYVCVPECVCETQGGEGMVRGSDGDIAGSRDARHCGAALGGCGGV